MKLSVVDFKLQFNNRLESFPQVYYIPTHIVGSLAEAGQTFKEEARVVTTFGLITQKWKVLARPDYDQLAHVVAVAVAVYNKHLA